jgi:hypothetical protein
MKETVNQKLYEENKIERILIFAGNKGNWTTT